MAEFVEHYKKLRTVWQRHYEKDGFRSFCLVHHILNIADSFDGIRIDQKIKDDYFRKLIHYRNTLTQTARGVLNDLLNAGRLDDIDASDIGQIRFDSENSIVLDSIRRSYSRWQGKTKPSLNYQIQIIITALIASQFQLLSEMADSMLLDFDKMQDGTSNAPKYKNEGFTERVLKGFAAVFNYDNNNTPYWMDAFLGEWKSYLQPGTLQKALKDDAEPEDLERLLTELIGILYGQTRRNAALTGAAAAQTVSAPDAGEAEKRYIRTMLEQCRRIALRDTEEKGGGQFAELYIFPTTTADRETDAAGNRLTDLFAGQNFCRLVTASSGCGKTSLLYAVVLACLTDPKSNLEVSGEDAERCRRIREHFGVSGMLPLLIEAADVNARLARAGTTLTLPQLAAGYPLMQEQSEQEAFERLVRQHAREGTLLILIDALDEVFLAYRQQLAECVESFSGLCTNMRLVMTSRPINLGTYRRATFQDLIYRAERWTLNGFDSDQIYELLTRWYSLREAEQKKMQINQLLSGHRYLRELIHNPFFLTHLLLLLSTAKEVERISALEVYRLFVNKLITKRWPLYENCVQSISYVLSWLAWDMHKSEPVHAIRRDELHTRLLRAAAEVEASIDSMLGDSLIQAEKSRHPDADVNADAVWQDMAAHFETRSGLLLLTDGQSYTFQTPELEDYLAAQFIYHYVACMLIDARLLLLPNPEDKHRNTQAYQKFTLEVQPQHNMKGMQNTASVCAASLLLAAVLPETLEDKRWKEVVLMLSGIVADTSRDNHNVSLKHVFRQALLQYLCTRFRNADAAEKKLLTELVSDLRGEVFDKHCFFSDDLRILERFTEGTS